MSGSELITGAPGAGLALLPANASAFEVAHSTVASRLFDLDVAVIEQSRDPAHCDAQFTPFLAWERAIHFYASGDEAGNRARVESAFEDHLNYGCPPALEAEIALDTGQTVQIVEFFEDPSLVWPEFAVASVIHPGDPAPDMDALMASALMRKNVRDWPIPRIHGLQPGASEYVGAACGVTIIAFIPPALPIPPQLLIGAAAGVALTAYIQPIGEAA